MSIFKNEGSVISSYIDSLKANIKTLEERLNKISSIQDGYNSQLEAQRKLLFQDEAKITAINQNIDALKEEIKHDISVLHDTLKLFSQNYDQFCAMEGLNILILAKDSYYCKTAITNIIELPWYKRLSKKALSKVLEEAMQDADNTYKDIINQANTLYKTKSEEVKNASYNATRKANTASNKTKSNGGDKGNGNEGLLN